MKGFRILTTKDLRDPFKPIDFQRDFIRKYKGPVQCACSVVFQTAIEQYVDGHIFDPKCPSCVKKRIQRELSPKTELRPEDVMPALYASIDLDSREASKIDRKSFDRAVAWPTDQYWKTCQSLPCGRVRSGEDSSHVVSDIWAEEERLCF
jgi:hypothetical protein